MLVLASGSPQRAGILTAMGVPFEARPSGADELTEGDPREVALENARRKGRAVAAGADAPVLAVDTLVALDGAIYGQPADETEAGATLRALSGRTHTVVSGAWFDGE